MKHEERLVLEAQLQDKTFSAIYLSTAYANRSKVPPWGNPNKEFLIALGTVIRAQRQNITRLAQTTKLTRMHIYKLMRGEGNPTVDTLNVLLNELGFGVVVVPLKK